MIPLLVLLALPQEGEVDRVMSRFFQARARAQSYDEFRGALREMKKGLETFLKASPSHPDAHRADFHLAQADLTERRWQSALKRLSPFPKRYPSSPHVPAARLAAGDALLELERDLEARAAFEEFLKLYPDRPETLVARLQLAVTYHHQGDYAEAERRLRQARKEHPDRPESWQAAMHLAILMHLQERNADARAELEGIIRGCPDEPMKLVARRHLREYLKLGSELPEVEGKDVRGKRVSTGALRGRVVILHVFDSATDDALAETATMRRAHALDPAGGVAIVGLAIDPAAQDLMRFMEAHEIPWPVIPQQKGLEDELPRLLDVRGLPSVHVLDRRGRLRFYNLARRDLLAAVRKLLAEK